MVMPWLTGLVLVLVLILVLLALGGALPGGARRGEDANQAMGLTLMH